MKNLKKVVAVLTTLTSVTAICSMAISASAEDIDMINTDILSDKATNEEEFIASFNDTEEIQVANYLIDSGVSLSDAELAMDIYEDGISNISSTTTPYFYSSNKLAPTDHYVIAVFKTPGIAYDDNSYLTFDTSKVMYGGSYSIYSDFSSYIEDLSCAYLTSSSRFKISLTSLSSSNSSPVPIVKFPINYTSLVTNELTGKNSLTYNQTGSFDYHTLAKGDVDHDGDIDSTDSALLLDYLVGSNDLGFSYIDVTTNIAKVVNKESGDFDNNGATNISDVVSINQYIAS